MNLFNLVNKPESKERVLVVYTGGTLGMRFDLDDQALVPMHHPDLLSYLPELKLMNTSIDFVGFDEALDSSDVNPEHWMTWARLVEEQYLNYTGFMFLHGTDTMAYSASALSFMLSGLSKPVVFTGAQLPLGSLRNDAKRNILTSLELLLEKREDGTSMIQEVTIYFNDVLLRGNRAKKIESSDFDAFESKNYRVLASTGVSVDFNENALMKNEGLEFTTNLKLNAAEVGSIKLYPGLGSAYMDRLLDFSKKKIIVLESFGSGNAPTNKAFLESIENYMADGGIVLNVSQCAGGKVLSGKYGTNLHLTKLGVLDGKDLTFEAAITKAMFVLGNYPDAVVAKLKTNLNGEMSV